MLSISESWQLLRNRKKIESWIADNQSLVNLEARLRKEIPARHRKAFVETWVYGHLLTRSRQAEAPKDQLFPLTIKVSPTLRCNLRCKGCFAANYIGTGEMEPAVLESVVAQAAALGIPSVGVIGGEPLLVPGIFELFKKFRRTGFYLATNGTLVDDKVIASLQELPNVVTIFSIEGFESTNDFLRGTGVFNRIISAMKEMKRAGLIFGFSTVVHKENLNEVVSDEYIDFMIGNGCFFGGFLPYLPVGDTPRYHVVCSQDEVVNYYRRIDTLTASKPLLVLKEGYSDGTFLSQGCGAGQTIHVTSRGEAEPCNGIEFSTNNIHSSSLKEIFLSDFFKDIRSLHPVCGKKCLTIQAPERVLQIVKKHNAQPTHEKAREHLEEYVARRQMATA